MIAFSRVIGPVPINCVISEKHSSEIEITGNPIETGAEVADHAYVKPKEVILEVADANAAATFAAMVRFQESRVPFILVTGLTVYEDMLIASIDATRDRNQSQILMATVRCKQVIIVSTGSASNEGVGASDENGDGSKEKSGKPGGKNSKSAARPSKSSATNPTTAARSASTVQAGDNPTTAVGPTKQRSLLSRIF